MEAVFSDADDDIDSVEWFSSIVNRSADRGTDAGVDRVTLSAPNGASSTRAKVRVADVQGNAAERNCEVVFGPVLPVPRIPDVRAEEGEALTFTVTLEHAVDEALTLYYATYAASARDDDYDAHPPTALRFASGERTNTITVQTSEDDRVERDETLYVYLAESTDALRSDGYPVDYLARAAGTIADDDDETPEAALVPRIADVEAEEGEVLEFTATLDRAPDGALPFFYKTYWASAHYSDFEYSTGVLQFDRGVRTQTFRVQSIEDDEDEEDEEDEIFHVYVSESLGDLDTRMPARYLVRATGTIRDDDEARTLQLTWTVSFAPIVRCRGPYCIPSSSNASMRTSPDSFE